MPDQPRNPKPLIFLAAVLCAGAIGLWVYFASRQEPEGPTQRYRITTAVDAAAIDRMIDVMKEEPEFAFYFNVLDRPTQRLARQEASAIILQNSSAAELLAQLKHAYARTQNLGATFYFMEYDEDFSRYPEGNPQLYGLFLDFIKEEFKLTILGVYYKVHFDAQFVFSWDELTLLAARKLREIHGEILNHRAKN